MLYIFKEIDIRISGSGGMQYRDTYLFFAWWGGKFNISWKDMELEYVEELEFNAPEYGYFVEIEQEVPPLMNGIEFLWFYALRDNAATVFEIRNEEEWEYVCRTLGVNDENITLDFSNYYTISMFSRLESMEYRKEVWLRNKGKNEVRIEMEDDFKDRTIYVYKMGEKLIYLP